MKKIAVYLFLLLMLVCSISAPKQQPETDGNITSNVGKDYVFQDYSVDYAVCVADRVRVRACGGMQCAELDTLPDGTPVTLIAWGEWYQIEYDEGEGFIYGAYVCEAE